VATCRACASLLLACALWVFCSAASPADSLANHLQTLPEPPPIEKLIGLPDPIGRGAYLALIVSEADKAGIPPALVDAVVRVESNFEPRALGGVGEIGLMQIRPETAAMLGYRGDLAGLYEPHVNVAFGVRYLAGAWRLAGGNLCRALTKYRAGHGEACPRTPREHRVTSGNGSFAARCRGGRGRCLCLSGNAGRDPVARYPDRASFCPRSQASPRESPCRNPNGGRQRPLLACPGGQDPGTHRAHTPAPQLGAAVLLSARSFLCRFVFSSSGRASQQRSASSRLSCCCSCPRSRTRACQSALERDPGSASNRDPCGQ
jgi:Transglycosylase SLT domain